MWGSLNIFPVRVPKAPMYNPRNASLLGLNHSGFICVVYLIGETVSLFTSLKHTFTFKVLFTFRKVEGVEVWKPDWKHRSFFSLKDL